MCTPRTYSYLVLLLNLDCQNHCLVRTKLLFVSSLHVYYYYLKKVYMCPNKQKITVHAWIRMSVFSHPWKLITQYTTEYLLIYYYSILIE
jgi:hypothetical protein